MGGKGQDEMRIRNEKWALAEVVWGSSRNILELENFNSLKY